ncbi:MAG: hypothetical protein ACPLKQ_06925 [Candidatus Bathyarchaeales archaeon]
MRFKRENSLVPVSVPCYDWKDNNGEVSRKTVIISPIRIIENGDGSSDKLGMQSRSLLQRQKLQIFSHSPKPRTIKPLQL